MRAKRTEMTTADNEDMKIEVSQDHRSVQTFRRSEASPRGLT